MSDELKNKSGKVKVMYVRSDDDSDKRTHNPRTGKGEVVRGKSRVDGRSRPARDERNSRGDDRKRDDRKRDDRKRDDFHRDDASPWRTVSRAPGDETPVKRRSRRDQREELYRSGSAASSACGRDPRIWRKRLPGAVPEPSGSYRSRLVYSERDAAL